MEFGQGLVVPFRSIEGLLELCWQDVGEIAVQALVVVPMDPSESGEFDVLDELQGRPYAGPRIRKIDPFLLIQN